MASSSNVFDQFDASPAKASASSGNPFDQFDAPSQNRAEQAAEAVLGDFGVSPSTATDIVGGVEDAGALAANTVAGIANAADYFTRRSPAMSPGVSGGQPAGQTGAQASQDQLVPYVSPGAAGGQLNQKVLPSLKRAGAAAEEVAGELAGPSAVQGAVSGAQKALANPDVSNALNFLPALGVEGAAARGAEAMEEGGATAATGAAETPTAAPAAPPVGPITPEELQQKGVGGIGQSTAAAPKPRARVVDGKLVPANQAPSAANPDALFEPAADENARTEPRTPAERQQLANEAHELGMNETRESALQGDRLEAATDFDINKYKNHPAGQRMAKVIEDERQALRNVPAQMLEENGGVADTTEKTEAAAGKEMAAPIDEYRQVLENQVKSAYEDVKAQHGETPLQPDALNKFLTENDPEFTAKASRGTALRDGVRGWLQKNGLWDAKTNRALPMNVYQAERLRQFVGRAYHPETAQLNYGLKDAIDDDVTKAAGADVYGKARQVRSFIGQHFEEQPSIAKLEKGDDRLGIDRKVPFEEVGKHIEDMSADEFHHYLGLLESAQRTSPELAKHVSKALTQVRAHFLRRILAEGDKTADMWNSKAVNAYLRANEDKISQVFRPQEIDRLQKLNRVGNAMRMDRSYRGADASRVLGEGFGIKALKKGAGALGTVAGAHVAGPVGALVGHGAAKGVEHLAAAQAERAVEKRIVNLADEAKPTGGAPRRLNVPRSQRGGPRMGDFTARTNNASGESSASVEAQNRLAQEKAKGQDRFQIDPDGNVTPLTGVDAVDRRALPGHVIVQRGVGDREFSVLDRGGLPQSHANGLVARAVGRGNLPARDLAAKFPGQRGGPKFERQTGDEKGGGKTPATVNIGLHTPEGGVVHPAAAVQRLKATGVKVGRVTVRPSNTEPTLVADLDRELTPEEAHGVSKDLHQEAIAQHSANGGELHGPGAEKWRPFNPDYFLTHSGRTLSEESKPIAEKVAAQRGGPKRPPLKQGEDPAAALKDAQVQKDVEAAERNPNGKRPPLRQGDDPAEAIYDEQARQDAARGARLADKFPGQRGGPKAERQAGSEPRQGGAVKTLTFRHFSNAEGAPERVMLSPDYHGQGLSGAERRRMANNGGPKVISAYAGKHPDDQVEPELRGKPEYRITVPESSVYNLSKDPAKIRVAAKALAADEGIDEHTAAERLLKEHGYAGYHMPGAQGVLKGQARFFKPVEGVRKDVADREALAAKVPGSEHFTPDEREGVKRQEEQKLVEAFKQVPHTHELAAAALAGEAKRGWYRQAAHAISTVFGADAPRFTALLAAMSPQTSVEMNFHNALRSFVAWDAAGRPKDAKSIVKIMEKNSLRNPLSKSKSNVLGAWRQNAIRALTSKDPESLQLSGPKVDSFAKNLRDNVHAVTLDSWMAKFAGFKQDLLGGLDRKIKGADTPRGVLGVKSPTYKAYSARVREAAELLTRMTGHSWTPEEVQETVWSWAKAASEHADETKTPIPKLLREGAIHDDLIRGTSDFHSLFQQPGHAGALRNSNFAEGLERLRGSEGPAQPRTPEEARAAAQARLAPHLREAADRLEDARNPVPF